MLDRTVAPPVQPLARVALPATEVMTLPNHARLHTLANDAQPVVRLQVALPAGKIAEPRPSLALLTARALLEGTATRTARQIADEVAFYGASLDCDSGPDRALLTLHCLTRHLPTLLPLVHEVLTQPAFPAPELAQLQTRTVQNVQVERRKAGYRASERFNQNLFGAAHPYGQLFDEAAFQALTRAEVLAFHRATYPLGGAEIFLCGDVAGHQQLVADTLGGGPAAGPALVAPAPPLAAFQPTTDHVAVSGSLQASLRIGRPWPAPQHPDTHRLNLLIKVLGGYFGSRLMRNIREDKGLTYGISASVSNRERAAALTIGTDVKGDSAPLAVAEIQHELRRLQDELIPADELETVKNYTLGKFANDLSTVFEQADKYRNIVLMALPADYYAQFVQQIEAADAPALQRLAQEYLSPAAMQVVVAGA
ncbi:M16 family metallopeptidase [Hymenobacter caeli]|uniref:Zn-dependent peptidase n=1 Tax=Hymenobacter caeli TaxID=2735894 RepID=A0ABX2FTX9_9BACT|nr:pitrilysin family protein [Hymenobacter caeli]NRT20579.1 putative Zn-dependent peptidase [Hymenobacter caeli]